MPVPGLLDRRNCRGRERPGQVDPFDLRAAGSGQGRDLDADDILHDRVLRRKNCPTLPPPQAGEGLSIYPPLLAGEGRVGAEVIVDRRPATPRRSTADMS